MADSSYTDQLIAYLKARGVMPEVRPAWLPDGVSGNFSKETAFGSGELPKNGVVSVGKHLSPQEAARTTAHELTHAADGALTDQYFEVPRGERGGDQFAQAFAKLRLGGEGQKTSQQLLAEALLGRKLTKQELGYRASSPELRAFGGGSTVAPNLHNRLGQHVDPTMATENAILLELAARKLKK